MIGRLAATAACLLALAVSGLAGETLSVRLVEASNAPLARGPGLEDVIPILRQNLVFANYALLAGTSLRLPARNQARDLGGYAVTCDGPQEALQIAVSQAGHPLLRTTISLRDNCPLVVGGFPSRVGRRVLVFVAR